MNIKNIEQLAQKIWKDQNVFRFNKNPNKKYYVLDMFPYPSGDGLHIGHIKGYTATDVVSHYMRLKGYDVLHPMGWDAFGLPAENYAIRMKKKPRDVVKENINKFKLQMKSLGFSYDWSREINTTDPEYFKWTQWTFLKMFKKGLAYQDNIAINFCPSCKTGLANEEVISGKCERCNSFVKKKKIRQWNLKITEYADRLLNDLNGLDWPQAIKEMQRNWIGKSIGSNVIFDVVDSSKSIEVFTTRIDTLYGCTYLVVSPEYCDIDALLKISKNKSEILEYINKAKDKSEIERTDISKEKTGIKLKDVYALNPVNDEKIEIYVADYILSSYGTGAVMAVPAHDERDFEFAHKYHIKIKQVVTKRKNKIDSFKKAFTDYGYLVNSGEFNGISSKDALKKITEKLMKIDKSRYATNYKLRDWIFSRQRYWGEPIPIIHCKKCGAVGVDEKDLPVILPEIESYEPSGNGESPLANIDDWVNTKCPKCGGKAKRETNTMPQWAGSCWYYLRYIDPQNNKVLIDYDKEKKIMPVDLYVGGAEHAVLHLLYARFWHKFLYDIKAVKTDEPFKKLRNVGLVLAPDHQKMSKSRGNVINPDKIVNKYGADSLRMYELFIGPFEKQAVWNNNGIVGTHAFINKIVRMFENRSSSHNNYSIEVSILLNKVSKKIESMKFNTIVSDFMKFANLVNLKKMNDNNWRDFIICLSPIAPHTSEYLWSIIGNKRSVFTNSWPKINTKKSAVASLIVQINGKKKGVVSVKSGSTKKEATIKALQKIGKNLKIDRKKIKRVVYVKDKVINFVIK